MNAVLDRNGQRVVKCISGTEYSVPDIWADKTVPEVEGVSEIAVRLATSRGIAQDDLGRYFAPRIADWMPNPLSLTGMKAGADVLCEAILNEKSIGIVGDYDVDGATSIAVIGSYLTDIGHADWAFHVPQRLTDGYGVTPKAVDYLRKKGCTTILVLDSGTLAFPAMEYARLMGMNMVIIDHHEPGRGWKAPESEGFGSDQSPLILDKTVVTIPDVAGIHPVVVTPATETSPEVVSDDLVSVDLGQSVPYDTTICVINPKREDDNSGLDHLCTAGLTIMLCARLNSLLRTAGVDPNLLPNIMDYSGFAALGTVADLMSLTGLNRAFVAAGLSRMHIMPGLAGLTMATRSISNPEEFPAVRSSDLGFQIGPAVNAAGRIDDCELGATTLMARDLDSAVAMGQNLVHLNGERKRIQEAVQDVAMDMARAQVESGAKCLIVKGDDWHPGVIGIVAGRLKEAFNLPSVVIGQGGKGSGRSAHGFNLGNAFHDAVHAKILAAGGGHKAAGGLTLADNPGAFDQFVSFMQDQTKDIIIRPSEIDGALPATQIGSRLVLDMEAMEPFGMGNPQPKWLIDNLILTGATWMGKGENGPIHLNLFLQPCGERSRFRALLWSAKGTPLEVLPSLIGRKIGIIATVSRDRRSGGGIPDVKVEVKDVILHDGL